MGYDTNTTPPNQISSDEVKKLVQRDDVEIRNQDMSPEHLNFALEIAIAAVTTYSTELEVAEFVKARFDEKFGPKWHCVVGRHFASHVSYEPNHYVYLKIGREVILLFKSGGPLAAENTHPS